MEAKIKIAIVEDEPVYRLILVKYLQRYNDFEIVITCSNGKELIEAIQKIKPDVVLSDLKMPLMDGVEITEYLNKNYPE
ncbi:MAG TPA: response regulator transcription factor, partial [Bacteroidia bacterium]|nr:response regulator transcription factor [Bacteroidia bacterium]